MRTDQNVMLNLARCSLASYLADSFFPEEQKQLANSLVIIYLSLQWTRSKLQGDTHKHTHVTFKQIKRLALIKHELTIYLSFTSLTLFFPHPKITTRGGQSVSTLNLTFCQLNMEDSSAPRFHAYTCFAPTNAWTDGWTLIKSIDQNK